METTSGGVEVSGLHREFGAVVAVDDISLTAVPGEVTALVGPNGSGKTTLLLMLATLLAPDRGQIRINGIDPTRRPREVRTAIGWMPDGFGTWDALSVREVLLTVCAAYDMRSSTARSRTDEVLDLLHLNDLADRRARVLSRGQKQRLGLARALVHEPSVLLLDEPASGLDPRSRIELRDVLRGLAGRGRTILVSSHILTELQEVADRAVIVSRGRTTDVPPLGTDAVSRAVGRWRVASLDTGPLRRWLDDRGVSWRPDLTATEVDVTGDEAAAALLAELVGHGFRITAFAPTQGVLEAAYLAATEERE